MLDGTTLLLFSGTAVLLLIVPGPAVLYIVARSLEAGRAAGFVSQLGLCVGLLVHVAGAALGLSALLVQSATAFAAVKYAGAAYLIWLGIRQLRTGAALRASGVRERDLSLRRAFVDGVVIDALNPKAALFFLAFLPQFVEPAAGSITFQLIILGLLFVALAAVTGSVYVVLATVVRRHVAAVPRRLTGWTYIGLGVAAAVVDGD